MPSYFLLAENLSVKNKVCQEKEDVNGDINVIHEDNKGLEGSEMLGCKVIEVKAKGASGEI